MRSNLIAVGSKKLVGKNAFCDIFKEICAQILPDYNVEIISFACPLRHDLNFFTISKYGIDLFNCAPQEKELVRPLMIEHGRIKRSQTQGQYFTNLAEIKIKEILNLRPKTIFLISDLRYSSKVSGYNEDEDIWVKKMGGIIVNIERFTINQTLGVNKVDFIQTDIPDEIKHSKEIKYNCDFDFAWQTTNNKELRAAFVRPFVDWFLN